MLTRLAVALCGILLYYVCHWAVFRRLTKELVPLPFVLGLRFYAQWCNEQSLRNQFVASLLGCLAFIWLLFNGVELYMIVGVVALALSSITAGVLLYARRQEARGVA